jgi:hypothetical protein
VLGLHPSQRTWRGVGADLAALRWHSAPVNEATPSRRLPPDVAVDGYFSARCLPSVRGEPVNTRAQRNGSGQSVNTAIRVNNHGVLG